jgi:hypothetical protein
VSGLSPKHYGGVWEILSGGNAAVQKHNSELEFDLEKLPQKTLRDLEKFVKSRLTPIKKHAKGQGGVKKTHSTFPKEDLLAPPKTYPPQVQQVTVCEPAPCFVQRPNPQRRPPANVQPALPQAQFHQKRRGTFCQSKPQKQQVFLFLLR